MTENWFVWALLSAVFAAFTAIFAKIGIAGVNSDPFWFGDRGFVSGVVLP